MKMIIIGSLDGEYLNGTPINLFDWSARYIYFFLSFFYLIIFYLRHGVFNYTPSRSLHLIVGRSKLDLVFVVDITA